MSVWRSVHICQLGTQMWGIFDRLRECCLALQGWKRELGCRLLPSLFPLCQIPRFQLWISLELMDLFMLQIGNCDSRGCSDNATVSKRCHATATHLSFLRPWLYFHSYKNSVFFSSQIRSFDKFNWFYCSWLWIYAVHNPLRIVLCHSKT